MKKYISIFILLFLTAFAGAKAQSIDASKSDVYTMIGTMKGGEVTRDFLINGTLTVSLAGCTVSKFTCTLLVNENQDLVSEYCTGNKLSAHAIEYIKKSIDGQKIFFEDINCICPDGSNYKLGAMIFIIKK